MEAVQIDVAPTFMTNFRANAFLAFQPRRLLSFLIAVFFLGYLAVSHPDPRLRWWSVVVIASLLAVRLVVIILSSVVTPRRREAGSMRLTLTEETVTTTRWGHTEDVGWQFIRRAYLRSSGIVLQIANRYDHVFVDRDRVPNLKALDVLLTRHGKL